MRIFGFDRRLAVAAAALLGLGGCGNIPHPDYFVPDRAGAPDGPTSHPTTFLQVADLVRHIQCEMVRAPNLAVLLADHAPDQVPANVAQVTLTLKVEDNGGVAPSLSFINPLTTGGTFSYALNGNLNLNRQRTFTMTYVVDLRKLSADKAFFDGNCAGDAYLSAPSLSGDLGINGIMAAALAASRTDGKYFVPTDSSKNLSPMPAYGTTVQFVLTASFDTGPGWKLTDITGPSGSKGLLSGGVVDTDTMIIAFSTAIGPKKDDHLDKEIADIQRKLDDLDKRGHQNTFSALDLSLRGILVDRLKELQARQAAGSPDAHDAASDSAHALTTDIILQNLTNQLR